ncbi:muscle M-line assembly protein unc-89 [Anastrepha ludens]|uniref:muscle M-line assembly protein unc-89 n=1 Tax=Anastrepha ludens TaxID=28586 RepID=UPI0023B007EF|nr:muscle M-line assembly protein unc-89 [Anastrepha ludens]XP_053952593.1 muscle M-line assembly protein unc-89 [Anastrepha ludens]
MGNQPGKLQNQNQSGRPKKVVTWKSAERPSTPGRPVLIPLSEQQPDVVNLRWERPKLDGGSPITGYVVEHRRMGSPHWVRATPTPVTQCEVSISGLEPGWRYQFRVFAENVVGRSDPSELSEALTVTLQRTAICVPSFIEELQDRQAVEDERIEFRVRVVGQPPPQINWFKDGYEVFSSRRTKILNDNDVSALIIHQVALTDEGEIKCTATNRAGHVATKSQLMVQAPPKIRLPRTYEDGLIVEAGEVLRLKVGVAGQPSPAVTWLHEGEIVPNSERFEISNTDRNSLLKIDSIQRNDRGEYSVRAWNQLGEDVTSFLVTVTARPNPPGKVRLNMSFGKSATLSWTSPLDDGGCKIGYYIVEYFRVGWNVWLKAATTRSLSTTLHDLIEGSEYKFRVKAENPYGVSEPSEESEVLFIPDPKRGITKPKSESKLTEEKSKSAPPRRKALSPNRSQADAATEISPGALRKPKPQLVDTEDLHREMNYGTSDKLLKLDIRRSPSNANATKPSSPVSPNTKLMTLNTKLSATPSPTSPTPKSPQRSPLTDRKVMPHFLQQLLPSKDKSPSPSKQKVAPPLATAEPELTPEKPSTPEISRSSLRRKRSLSPLRKSPTLPEEINRTPALQRSAEPAHLGVNQLVRRHSGHSLSPAKNAPTLAVAIATGAMGMRKEKSPQLSRKDRKEIIHRDERAGRDEQSISTRAIGMQEEKSPQLNKKDHKEIIQRDEGAGRIERTDRTNHNNGQDEFLRAERSERSEQRKRQPEQAERIEQSRRPDHADRLTQAERDKQAEWIEWVKKANGNNAALQNKNHYNHNKQTVSTLTNPTIEISAPPPSKTLISPSPPTSPLSLAEKQDDVHTSNEFMLVVFDKNSKVKDKNKQDSFELDLEDALQPPPISISSPDLASLEFTNLHTFPLRRSVSSTELLYERAMARFYEAVELEEAEKARKLKSIQEKDKERQRQNDNRTEKELEMPIAGGSLQPPFVRKRLGSMTEAERLSFERRSELRRQSESFVQELRSAAARWGSRENLFYSKPLSRTTGLLLGKDENREERDDVEDLDVDDADDYDDMLQGEMASGFQSKVEPTKQASFELESDYTESTASSDDDSIEKFKMELRARTKTPSPPRASPPKDHMETYHPRNMSAGVFTPYRAPMPENAAIVLTRPAPLTDPDFVPKPILKRPSNENVQPLTEQIISSKSNSNNNVNKQSLENIESISDNNKNQAANNTASSHEKSGFAESIMSFFKRDSRANTEKNIEENVNFVGFTGKPIPLSPTVVAAELEAKRKAKEEDDSKRKEAERTMREEAYAVVDHYSDLVSQISSTRKYHTPIYLDKEELKKAGGNTDNDEEMRMRRSQSPEGGLMPPISNKPRLSISERGQLVHVRETGSGMAFTEPPKALEPDTPTPSESSSQAFSMSSARKEIALPSITSTKTNLPATPITKTISSDLLASDDNTTAEVISETLYEHPDSRGRTRIVKVKRIIKKRVPSRSRDASLNRPPSSAASQQDIDIDIPTEAQSPVRRRVLSRTRTSTGQSKSPGPFGRRPLPPLTTATGVLPPPPEILLSMAANYEKVESKSAEQLEEEAHEKVRSALSYSTDLVLFMVACYVYLFKDAWLVLPILSLMIYRQLGDFINDCIPKWMKRKKN